MTRQLQGLGNLAPFCQLSQGSPPKPSPPPLSLASPSPHSLCSVHRSVQRLQFRKVQPAAHLSGRLCGRQPPHAPGPKTQEEPQSGQQVGDRVSPRLWGRGRTEHGAGLKSCWGCQPTQASPAHLGAAGGRSWSPRLVPPPQAGMGSGRAGVAVAASPVYW